MQDNSWVKFYRKTFDNAISSRPNYLAVWIYILCRANHKQSDIILNGKKRTLKSGEFLGSLRKISDHFSISIATVKTIIDYLESEKMLNTERTKKYTIFQVLNYDEYQNTEHELKSNRNQTETDKNDNNDKNILSKDNIVKQEKFKTFWDREYLGQNEIPKEWGFWAYEKYEKRRTPKIDLDKEIDWEFETFKTYWENASKNAVKKDWFKAWQVWWSKKAEQLATKEDRDEEIQKRYGK